MCNTYENSQSYKDFIDRISMPDGLFKGMEGCFSDEYELELLKSSFELRLKSCKVTQRQLIDEDSAEYIEQFGLQHLVSGGWTPLKNL